MLLIIIILIIVLIIALKSKKLKIPNVYLITGGVKTGKSALSVKLAIRQYKKNLRIYYVKRFLCKCLHKPPVERPELYSNIKLRYIKHHKLTIDIIERKKRIPYKSVVLIDEASLLCDSMYYKHEDINEKIMLFVKLFGHYSRGGTCIINTQSLKDMHHGFKRCISTYLWIHSKAKMPFLTIFKVREMVYSEDNETSNNFNEDVEESTKTVYMLNSTYRKYDCYCYSVFTDDLEIYYSPEQYGKTDSLKTPYITSFRDWKTLPKEEEPK